jgi:hypothetical protein
MCMFIYIYIGANSPTLPKEADSIGGKNPVGVNGGKTSVGGHVKNSYSSDNTGDDDHHDVYNSTLTPFTYPQTTMAPLPPDNSESPVSPCTPGTPGSNLSGMDMYINT